MRHRDSTRRSKTAALRALALALALAAGVPAAAGVHLVGGPSEVPIAVEVTESTPEWVSFQLTNLSERPVRDMAVVISHVFRWDDEFRPGADNPSRAATYEVPVPLAPQETQQVTFALAPPLAPRDDGRFEVGVSVLRWTAVLPRTSQVSP